MTGVTKRGCQTCGGPAEVKGSGGARSCLEHIMDIAEHRPLWMRLPEPRDDLDLAALEASGALSPEGAAYLREELAALDQLAAEAGDAAPDLMALLDKA